MDAKNRDSLVDAELAISVMLTQLLDDLIDYPERCSVDITRNGETTAFVVHLEQEDLVRVTGGRARTARSFQMLISAIGLKSQKRFSLIFRD
jgi:predicted RNA-binding protein YlqC (UPF0109 family)